MSDVASLGSRVAALLAMTGKKDAVEGAHLRVCDCLSGSYLSATIPLYAVTGS
jgi:hypothetical protein